MADKLENLLVEFLKLTHRQRQRERENVLHGRHLVPRDVEILEILFEHHPHRITFKEIVGELDMGAAKPTNRSTISQAITRLMKDHRLVEKVLDVDGDQRQPIIRLTDSGISLATALGNIDKSLIPKFIDAMNLNDSSKKRMIHVLDRGIKNFQMLSNIVQLDFKDQKPNVARIYDYVLGGTHNFAVDRELADSMLARDPALKLTATASRAFLRRSVHFLAKEKGINQFVDIGSGLPTVGNTHEIVHDVHTNAKVVYVDKEKDAVTASNILLKQNRNVQALCADLRDPDKILAAPEMKLIDFENPVAIVMVLVLQFIPDNEEALLSVKALKERLAPGSCLVIAHPTKPPEMDTRMLSEIEEQYSRAVTKINMRSKEEVLKFFDGMELVPPGLVYTPLWNPDLNDPYLSREDIPFTDEPFRSLILAGVGVK